MSVFHASQTIIFLRQTTKSGFELSGYIDFAHSLSQTCSRNAKGVRDWTVIFREKKRLWPMPSDLGYFNWRSNVSSCKSNENYKVNAKKYFLLTSNLFPRKN
jgi:hypothetical protein